MELLTKEKKLCFVCLYSTMIFFVFAPVFTLYILRILKDTKHLKQALFKLWKLVLKWRRYSKLLKKKQLWEVLLFVFAITQIILWLHVIITVKKSICYLFSRNVKKYTYFGFNNWLYIALPSLNRFAKFKMAGFIRFLFSFRIRKLVGLAQTQRVP